MPGKKRRCKTHCINGHEKTPDNVYRRPDGTWDCRVCRNISRRKSARKRRLEREEAKTKAVRPELRRIYFDAQVIRGPDGSLRIL